jgi:hypothetical protein
MQQLMTVGTPRNFRMREAFFENLLAVIPAAFLYALPIGIILGILAIPTESPLLLLLGLVLGCAGALMLYFMPVVGMNPFIRHIVFNNLGPKPAGAICYDCQIALSPKYCTGLRKFLEDADDVGRLEINAEGVVFIGDYIHIQLPFEHIDRISRSNCGYRVLWILGTKIRIWTTALEGVDYFEFHDREANTITTSWRNCNEIFASIDHGLNLALRDRDAKESPKDSLGA